MKVKALINFIFVLSLSINAQEVKEALEAKETLIEGNKDLIYDKMDRQVPANVNDDHMVIRKIKASEVNNIAVSGGNIYFDLDKSNIVPTEHIKLEEISKALIKLDSRLEKVLIEGFASTDGDPNRNFDLGIERATAVKKALAKLNIADDKLEAVSYGEESMYKFQNINKNRRVQLKILLKQKN